MKKYLLPLLFVLVAFSRLLAQGTMAVPLQHLEATYSSDPNATITWSADLQNNQPPYQYLATVTIKNNTSVTFSGWDLGLTGPWTSIAMNNPLGDTIPSFVILRYATYDFDTQQSRFAPYSLELTETPHYNFTSGNPNQGTLITMAVFGGNAFKSFGQSSTADLAAGTSISFSYKAELPISEKLVVTVPPQIDLSYSTPSTIIVSPDQTGE